MSTAAQLVKVSFENCYLKSSSLDVLIFCSHVAYLQPVTLELGGKSPIVVFEDVDLDKG